MLPVDLYWYGNLNVIWTETAGHGLPQNQQSSESKIKTQHVTPIPNKHISQSLLCIIHNIILKITSNLVIVNCRFKRPLPHKSHYLYNIPWFYNHLPSFNKESFTDRKCFRVQFVCGVCLKVCC